MKVSEGSQIGSAVRLGIVPLCDCAPVAVAQETGIFHRQGLRVKISKELGERYADKDLADIYQYGQTIQCETTFNITPNVQEHVKKLNLVSLQFPFFINPSFIIQQLVKTEDFIRLTTDTPMSPAEIRKLFPNPVKIMTPA